ncbi:MAG: type IV pilin N-terminal domain-containing protein, partial [Methanoregula sp.]|nr:type IV pilin N-terminal domain-containing protein [Methanoregula sp.]
MRASEKKGVSMRIDRSEKRKTDTSAGVSETIGAIMLISIVAVLIAVIGVYLFSQPVPQKIPNLNFMTGVNSDKSKLYLYHNGGDTMIPGEFSVLLDGVPKSYSVAGGGSWSLGKNLEINITPSTMPQRVMLVYNNTASSGGPGSTGAVLLNEASANVVRTGDVSADQLPYLDCSAVRNWDCADQIPAEIIIARSQKDTVAKRISFMQWAQTRGTVIGGASNHF